MSKKRPAVASLIVVGPSASRPQLKKDTYYENVYSTFSPISELELEVAVFLRKDKFTVEAFVEYQAQNALEYIRFGSLKRPYFIIKRYESWDEIIEVDKQTLYKVRVETENGDFRFHQVQLEDESRWRAQRDRTHTK